MKKILTILLLISVAHAQDTTRSKIDSKERLQIAAERDATAGKTDDSTRIRTLYGHKVERIGGLNGVYSIKELGVKPDGTDQTGQLLKGLVRNYVKELIVDDDTSSVFTFNTNITIPAGIKIVFKNGCKFKGVSGTQMNINSNQVEGDYNAQIFDTSLRVSNVRTNTGAVPAAWFGAVSDGITNNSVALTRAQAATPKDLYVGLGWGKTMVGSTLIITKSLAGLGYNKNSSLIYNPSASGTDLQLANVSADSVNLYNLVFDGSNKCRLGVLVNNNYKRTVVSYCSFINIEQQGSETNNAAGFVLQNGNDGAWIHHNLFTNINAKNNGISRGLWAVGTTSPKRVIIEDNRFDGISNVGAGSLDADQAVWQDYTDSAGVVFRNNDFYNIYKRGIKAQAPGVLCIGNRFWSTAYKGSVVSNSAISLYRNQSSAVDNYIYDGAFEAGAIEIGDGSIPVSNVEASRNYIQIGSGGAQAARDGIRVNGIGNKAIALNFNRIFGGHYGIYLRDGGRNYSIIGNEVYGTSDNAIITTSANTYPNNWRSDMQMIGNKIFKCAQAAFAIGRINGGSFAFNSIDSCSDDFILNYNVYIDSLIGVIASGNTVSPAGYGSGKRVNIGAYAQRLPLSNPKSLPGLQYIATDNDSNFTYMWQGGAYVKIGGIASTISTDLNYVRSGNLLRFNRWIGIGVSPLQALHVGGKVQIDTIPPVTSAGNVLTNNSGIVSSIPIDSIVKGSSYSPTLTNTTNITSSILQQANYTKIGNVTSVMIRVLVSPTSSSTATTLTFSLPATASFGGYQAGLALAIDPGGTKETTPTVIGTTTTGYITFTSVSTSGVTLVITAQYVN